MKLVNLYTAHGTKPNIKEAIVSSFCKSDGVLRILIATVAFGMGLDCPNVRHIIHWGPMADKESYIQQIGRAGRDGKKAMATLYYRNQDLGWSHVEPGMREYCKTQNDCRRTTLFSDFDTNYNTDLSIHKTCACCDVCAHVCSCNSCTM